MHSLGEDPLTENLRQTNRRLRFWLESLDSDPAHPAPQLISELLSELRRAGVWLRGARPEECGARFQVEMGEYRQNLERLRDRMPAIHRCLLAERARLEAERTRIESAVEWVQGSRQTL